MATKKKASKRSAPKIKISDLPNREAFIRDELGELLEWSESRVDAYIEKGQIRRAFDTIKADEHLRSWQYYKCKAKKEQLSALKHDEPLSAFVDPVIEENFISCPRYLYLPMPPPIIIPDPSMLQGTIDYETTFRNAPPELFSGTWVMLSHFYHFDGSVLIPVEEGYTNFPLVKLQFELLEFPLEETERHKQNKNTRQDKGPYNIRKREQRMKQVQKLSKFDPTKHRKASHSQKTNNKATMRVAYFELFAKEVELYEKQKNLPERTFAEIQKKLENDTKQINAFNNTWEKMFGEPDMTKK